MYISFIKHAKELAMVGISDGSSEIGAHISSDICNFNSFRAFFSVQK